MPAITPAELLIQLEALLLTKEFKIALIDLAMALTREEAFVKKTNGLSTKVIYPRQVVADIVQSLRLFIAGGIDGTGDHLQASSSLFFGILKNKPELRVYSKAQMEVYRYESDPGVQGYKLKVTLSDPFEHMTFHITQLTRGFVDIQVAVFLAKEESPHIAFL